MSPQLVNSNKNDFNDALAILDALSRPTMRFVSPKRIACQAIPSIHRVRQRYIQSRRSLANQMRGLLMAYGKVVSRGISHLRGYLACLLERSESELTSTIASASSDCSL